MWKPLRAVRTSSSLMWLAWKCSDDVKIPPCPGGCFEDKAVNVASALFPLESKEAQAWLYLLSSAKATTLSNLLGCVNFLVLLRGRERAASLINASLSPSNHRCSEHRVWFSWARLCFRPARGAGARTALGRHNNSTHAASNCEVRLGLCAVGELRTTMDAKARARTEDHKERQLRGMWRMVGRSVPRMRSRSALVGEGRLWDTVGSCAAPEGRVWARQDGCIVPVGPTTRRSH